MIYARVGKINYGAIIKESSCPPPWEKEWKATDEWDYDGQLENYWNAHCSGKCPLHFRLFDSNEKSRLIITIAASDEYIVNSAYCYTALDPAKITQNDEWESVLIDFCALANLEIVDKPGWFLLWSY